MTLQQYLSLSSAALRESPNSIPVQSLKLSSHLFFCLPLLLAPFIVPCRNAFAMPEDLEMWRVRFFNMIRRSSWTPVAFWILLRTSSFVTWSLLEMFRGLLLHLISRAWILLSSSTVNVQLSQAWRKVDKMSLTLEVSKMFLSVHMIFSPERAAVVWAILERISGFDPSLEMIAPRYLIKVLPLLVASDHLTA